MTKFLSENDKEQIHSHPKPAVSSGGVASVQLPKPTADQQAYLEQNIKLSTAEYDRRKVIGGRRNRRT